MSGRVMRFLIWVVKRGQIWLFDWELDGPCACEFFPPQDPGKLSLMFGFAVIWICTLSFEYKFRHRHSVQSCDVQGAVKWAFRLLVVPPGDHLEAREWPLASRRDPLQVFTVFTWKQESSILRQMYFLWDVCNWVLVQNRGIERQPDLYTSRWRTCNLQDTVGAEIVQVLGFTLLALSDLKCICPRPKLPRNRLRWVLDT